MGDSEQTGRRVALVTGAARGLGLEVARQLSAQACDLMLVDVDPVALEAARETLPTGTRAQVADVSDPAACRRAVAATIDAFGRLDILCNAAGIVKLGRTVDFLPEDYQRIMAINAGGTFYLSQSAIPHLLETDGNIVNVASQSGVMGSAYQAAYGASKAAVIQMTKAMAVEFADSRMRINAVCPGGIATRMGETPPPGGLDMEKIMKFLSPRGLSQPSEIAALIAFVASPAASAIHGAVLLADNGVSAG